MYQPNEPIRGKYLISMEVKISEEIEILKARRKVQQESPSSVAESSEIAAKRIRKTLHSFFGGKTDRSVSSDMVAMQPNFLG